MERIEKRLDSGSYAKLVANLINNESLITLDDGDLVEMGIVEKGPRKIILSCIAQLTEVDEVNENQDENTPANLQHETIRSILAKETRFNKILTRKLDYGTVPYDNELSYMNRILTKHYFEDNIIKEQKYPTWQEKHELAVRILEAFPQLEKRRENKDAPKESYFFWKHGGQNGGPHSGVIETRVGNMRKHVLPENRLFKRKKMENIVLPDDIRDNASTLAALTSTPQNGRTVSEGMAECTVLHKYILQQKNDEKVKELITTFPHLLAYNGIMVQQAFERLNPTYNKDNDISTFLCIGLLMDQSNWIAVENKCIRGALRIMKKLPNRGVKRTAESNDHQGGHSNPIWEFPVFPVRFLFFSRFQKSSL